MVTDIKLNQVADNNWLSIEGAVIDIKASDLILESGPRPRTPAHFKRALVHGTDDSLVVNFNDDYPRWNQHSPGANNLQFDVQTWATPSLPKTAEVGGGVANQLLQISPRRCRRQLDQETIMDVTRTPRVQTNASASSDEERCRILTNKAARTSAAGAFRFTLALVSGAAMMLAATYASADPGNGSIEGVWRVTRHGVNCATGQVLSSFPAIMAFSNGESYTGYAVPPGATPAQTSPEYGTWQREHSNQSYSFRILTLAYDNSGAFAGSTEITGDLNLEDRGESFVYESTIQFFDTTGSVLATRCGKAAGTRFQ